MELWEQVLQEPFVSKRFLLSAEEIDLFLFYSNIIYGHIYDCFS